MRATKNTLTKRFEELKELYTFDNGMHLELDYYPLYGGYNIDVIEATSGGVHKSLNGYANRLSTKEMIIFIDGILLGLNK